MSQYMVFEELPTTGKTQKWAVRSKRSGDLLGIIKWYGAWRQYTFCPEPLTIFNRGCLEDVNTFMDTQMQLRGSK